MINYILRTETSLDFDVKILHDLTGLISWQKINHIAHNGNF